eukprot:gb/GECH01011840.1/.p1 GENE.gb/GECH01011840.1/~~gb/GECH01011840.1/.p1  ORF type:complete len:1231 (+),score=299.55 gb/GECH01011840.1/:1-3693(+)
MIFNNSDTDERMTEPLLSTGERGTRRGESSNVGVSSSFTTTEEEASTRHLHVNDTALNEGYGFADNTITTSKYRYYNFIFKNILEQLMRAANAYFLFISILQLIPGLSPTGRFTTLVPLIGVMSVTAIKDFYEDWKRHISDRRVNNSKTHVFRGVDFVPCRWSDLRVGDLVRIQDMETFPADIVLLNSSEPLGLCYVETSSLDGETNLKLKRSRPETYESIDTNTLSTLSAHIECELPNKRLHSFEGSFYFNDNKISLDEDNLLLRGSTLRNTKHAIGVVVFTGQETKLMQNSAGAQFKQSQVEKMTNKQILLIFLLELFLCIVCAIGSTIWIAVKYNDSWYLQVRQSALPAWNGFKSIFTFIILFNNLIPISLYVSMEMAKIIQAYLINNDRELYYSVNDTPASAQTSGLNEELGQVQYVFSDKTGTLTCNKMEFFKFCVDGERYGVGTTEIGRAAAMREGRAIDEETPPSDYDTSKFKFYDSRILNEAWKRQPNSDNLKEFFTILAVCHTVIPEKENVDDPESPITYQAASPDEGALVKAAEKLGFKFKHRTLKEMTVEIDGEEKHFDILSVLEFTSARKRMSIVLRDRDQDRIFVYTKGADNVIFDRLYSNQEHTDDTLKHLKHFATQGLRTLVCARRELSEEEYKLWSKKYKEASTAVLNREKKLAQVAEEVECDLELVGATAIEDRLQDGVPDTIAQLATADIKVWMLTGDKQETAINIGFACSLLDESLGIVDIEATTHEEMAQELPQKLKMVKDSVAEQQDVALVIDGKKLDLIFPPEETQDGRDGDATSKSEFATMFFKPPTQDDPLVSNFFDMAILCRSVICCRVSPSQKAQIVRLVKDRLRTVTLSIGDGANDVSMILESHVGVGINGEEGLQAARSADYAIAQFRFLQRLLFVHGRWSYRRISKLILYSFYKNIVLYLTQFWFVFFNGFSGTSIYDKWAIAMFNVIFTSLPILGLAIFDRDLSAERAMDFPELYVQGQKNRFFNTKVFWSYILNAIWHSMVCFFVPFIALNNVLSPLEGGHTLDMIDIGIAMYTAVVIVVNLKVAIETSTFNWVTVVLIGGSILSWFVFVIIYGSLFAILKFGDFAPMFFEYRNFGSILFWLVVLLTVTLALSRDLGWKFYLRSSSRQLYYAVQKADATGRQIEKDMMLQSYPMEESVDIELRKKKSTLAKTLPSGLELTARRIFRRFRYHGFAFSQSGGQATYLEERLRTKSEEEITE